MAPFMKRKKEEEVRPIDDCCCNMKALKQFGQLPFFTNCHSIAAEEGIQFRH